MRKSITIRKRWMAAVLWAFVLGCGGGGGGTPPGGGEDGPGGPSDPIGGTNPGMGISGPGTFTVSPFDLADSNFQMIVPLGLVSPPAHTFPTDHMYFNLWDKNVLTPVYAPAAGKIVDIIHPGDDSGIDVRMTDTFVYRLGHLKLLSSLKIGDWVQGGQMLGTNSGFAGGIDFWTVNDEVTLPGFVVPSRYNSATIHCDSPLKHYEEPLRSALYSKVTRVGPDKDGKIDFDVPGKLVGNWFWEGVITSGNPMPQDWNKTFSFAPDVFNPAYATIAIGDGPLTMSGRFAPQSGATDPSQVTPASGKVSYRLYGYDWGTGAPQGNQLGLLIVQMLEDGKIKVQTFNGNQAATDEFTPEAKIFVR